MWQARSPEGLAAETTGVSSQVPSTSSPSQGLDAWAAWRETHGESAEQADDDGYYDPAWDAGYEEEQWHDDQWLYHSYGGPQQKATSSGWNDTDWEGSGASAAQGWLSDAQLRDFNTASVQRMSAMADGKWAGSFNLAGEYGGYAWSGEGAPQEKQTERLKVPSFDGGGDGDDIGKSARSYVRKVQVWLRCTRMPPRQRALALYDALTDKAWVYAEELDVDMLGSEYGVPYFLEWVQTRFMEVEVSKIAQMMNDLFRRTKRRHDQSVRDFNLEFERMVLRLHEIKCELPPLVKAWLYVDKLRLSEQEEVALLASVGNEYDVKKLQHAALVQDRTLRKGGTVELWRPGASKGRFAGRQQTAHVTQADACSSDEDFGAPHDAASDSSMVVEEGVAMEQHTAFMTYQNAKMKYREAMKGRGTDPEELRRRSEERLKLAKQRSYCSACKRRGHWHKDPECPLRRSGDGGPGVQASQHAQVFHTVQHCYMVEPLGYTTSDLKEAGRLKAIVDTACTKSVAGYDWFEKFCTLADTHGFELRICEEVDYFKFGASRVHRSAFSVWMWFGLAGKWIAGKIAIVQCPVPLLLSRPALAQLGMTFDVAAQQATFRAVNLEGLPLALSETGHPALVVDDFPVGAPPCLPDGIEGAVWIPTPEQYMVADSAAGGGFGDYNTVAMTNLFYPKKVPLEVENMLKDDTFSGTTFFTWWKHAKQNRDFWVETPHEMIRIHVVPRNTLFEPSSWKNSQPHLKKSLLGSLQGARSTEAVSCLFDGVVCARFDDRLDSFGDVHLPASLVSHGPWIGRSRFLKHAIEHVQVSHGYAQDRHVPSAVAMEDEEGRDPEGTQRDTSGASQQQLDSAGASHHAHRVSPEPRTKGAGGPHEGHHQVQPDRVDRTGQGRGDSHAPEADKGLVDQGASGVEINSGRHDRALRQVQRMALQGSPSPIPCMGCGRSEGQRGERSSRPGQACHLGCSGAGADRQGALSHSQPGPGPGSPGVGASTFSVGHGSLAELGQLVGQGDDPSSQSLCSDGPCPEGRTLRHRVDRGRHLRRGDHSPGGAPGGIEAEEGVTCSPQEASPLPSVHDEDKGVKFGDEADLDEFEDALDGEDLFDTHGVLFCDSLQWLDAREYEFDYELASEDDGVSGYEDTFEYVSGGLDDFHTGGHAFLTEDTPGNLEYSDDTLLYKDEGGSKTPRERAKEGLRRRRRMNQTSYKKFQQQLFTLSHVFLACTAAVGALAHEIIAEPATDLWRVFQPSHSAWMTNDDDSTVECLELFAGQARISEAFAKKRRGVLEPVDLKYGHDLRDPRCRSSVVSQIRSLRPTMVWMAPPCTVWCGFSNLNYDRQQRRRLRAKEKPFLELIDEVIVEQHRHGGFAVVENPKTSAIWQEPVLQRWVGDANSMLASVDLCRYGMTSEGGHIPLKKSLSLLCTSRTFAEQISKTCDRSHDHQPIQGRETARSAVYPTSFANAVVRAFDKHVCQGRVPTTVFAVDAPAGSDRATPAEEPEEDPEEPAEYGANAVSFKGRVNPTVASLLKRVHQNLGHPPNKELVKHLRIGGAPPAVVQAAEQLKCRTCEKSSKAKVQKISSPVVYLDFNEAIAADILWVDTIDAKNKPCLNIVDLASTYQVVVPLRSTKSEEVAQAFINGWISWAGAPKHLLVDLDSAFKDKFLSMLDQRSITVRCAAGQAHWQNGVAERHGGSWKLIYAKLSEDHLITEEELPEAVAACNDAKNSLRNRSGYSPRQWVFGAQARTVGDLFDGDQELAANHAASADAKFSRSQVIRNGARVAFFRCQTKEALQRAINHRPRVEGRNYDPGELVYYFREVRQGKSKKPTASWCGPAVVIGREGQNYWLARGGRCLLVAPEHLREACHEEVSEMLRLKLAMKEVQDLIKSDDGENYEVIDDGGAPDGQELVPDPEGRVEMEASAEVDDDLAMAANREELIRTSARRAHLLDDVPLNIKRARTAGSAFGPQQVFMAKKCISAKAKEKQLEKELPWGLIPPEERHLYRQAEEKQWAEHIDFGAVKPLTVSESEEVLKTVDPSRILRARFAYKDKNHAKRKVDKNIPCKPKARLCVAGQHDPDLGILDMSVDAPTAGRHSILLAIQLALCRDWSISVGDIRAAFLNGVPAPRQLYFRQPRGGIPSLDPRQLVEVVKGVFGLSTSPKLWWMKLSGDLKEMEFEFESDTIQVVQNPIDPCVFMFRGRSSRATRGLLLTHVDDLMLLAETGLRQVVEKKLLQKFPVDEWQTGDFEYVGSEYKVEDNQVSITQTSYVEGRLSRVTVPTDGNITKEHLEENRTAIGALSWLAKQTRPDLQFTVSQAQKKQNDPSIDDLKEVNKAVDSAIRHKEKGIILRKIDEHTLTFLAYHDAAWGNANDPSLEDPEWMGDHKVSSQIGTVVFMVDEQCLGKKEGRFSLVDWKSRGCHRVCRSTFAGETMACNEAMGDVIYLRGLLLSMVHGEVVSESKAGEKMAVHLVTDCKSLFDHVHREGIPKAPTEKRLAIDLASLRQCLMQEALHQWKKVYGANTPMAPEKPCRPPLHWLPTGAQLADIMTKWMKPDNWWDTLSAGVLHLPLKLQKSNEKETDFTGM